MKAALELARKGLGLTGINPTVGAVLVKSDKIIGKGFHVKKDLDHAEVVAMRGLTRKQLKGATLYVTLEPCCHKGKTTPPCTEMISAMGIRRVVAAARDPNIKVNGKGLEALKKAGIDISEGISCDEAMALNEAYGYSIRKKLPFVALKNAMSMDGRIAAMDGSSRWISCRESREFVHIMRREHDAVMTTAATVMRDDPRLDVRLVTGRDPKRVIIDWRLQTSVKARIYTDRNVVVIASSKVEERKLNEFRRNWIEVRVHDRSNGMKGVLKELYKDGIGNIMVEAGGKFAAGLMTEGLVNRIVYFIAPKVIGSTGVPVMGELAVPSIKDAINIGKMSIKQSGKDIMIDARVL